MIIVGNLGIDPEVRTLENGTKLARLRVATSESYMSKDGQKVEQTEWHTIVVWRALADIAERYLSKGKQVYIEGKLKTRSWKDQEGNDRYATEIVGDNMQLLGRPSGNDSGNQGQSQSQPQTASASPGNQHEDDLPF